MALTMEGKFAGEGLQSIDEDDDMLSAMARELVERNGIGDTADSVWRALTTIIRNYSREVLIARILPHSSKRRALCWILRLLPRVLLKAPWTARLSSSSASDQNPWRESGDQGPLSPSRRLYSA